MIFTAIKLVTKAATIIAVANTGYEAYKKGKKVYGAYKRTKKIKAQAKGVINGIKKVVKKT